MVISQNKGTQYGAQDTIILIMGTPQKVPLLLGNPHIDIPKDPSTSLSAPVFCAHEEEGQAGQASIVIGFLGPLVQISKDGVPELLPSVEGLGGFGG